jgi:hypothetical protein
VSAVAPTLSAMIPIDASSLLAQVLPVGVFVLMLECRQGMTLVAGSTKLDRGLWATYWVIFTAGALAGLAAAFTSCAAVVAGTPSSGIGASISVFGALMLFFAVIVFTLLTALSASGLGARITGKGSDGGTST